MRAGDGGRKIQYAEPLKTPGRDISGILPFCHSGLPELL
jgi:hypothetical protein